MQLLKMYVAAIVSYINIKNKEKCIGRYMKVFVFRNI